jgi:uncharacterized protein (DUF1800 family)
MSLSNRIKNQHLLWRSAFGPMAENAALLDSVSQKELWALLVKTSAKPVEKIEVTKNPADDYMMGGTVDAKEMQKAVKDPEQRKKLREKSKDDLKTMNLRWLETMVNSEAQLREKVSLFWHGHFACRTQNSFFAQELLQIVRTNALGSFADMLKAVSKSPAMLQFLNNQQNKKQKPNENFAREVMELFTMGRGNYTENDVKEAARAFTGWAFNAQGEFVFRKFQHDDGSKTFLGKTGNFNGDDILNMLLENKQTANYISKKIYRYFVNENVNEQNLQWLSNRFYANNYNIAKLLEDIYTSDWFYNEKNIGNKIKSPVELLAGIRRLLPMQMENDQAQLLFQRALGQILFYPPNVAGWPGGKSWIDSSSLMLRLRIPQILSANDAMNIMPKGDDDVQMGMMEIAVKKMKDTVKGGTAAIDWITVNKIFEKVQREKLLENIATTILQTRAQVSTAVLDKYVNTGSRENFIKSAVVNLMATPEYQLC